MSFDINDPETKAALATAIEEATTGLAAKNKELLGKLATAKKGQEIDPQVVADLEAANEKLHSDLVASQKAAKDLAKTSEATAAQLKAESTFTQKLLIDNGLLESLAKHGVTNPVHQKAALAMLRDNVKIVVDGESRKAMFGDKDLAASVAEWATGEEGKHFVTANINTGGGSGGGDGKGGAKKTWTREQYDNADAVARSAHVAAGGTIS